MINKVLIIAEAGVNHNGSLENAKKLILAGAEAGVDALAAGAGAADFVGGAAELPAGRAVLTGGAEGAAEPPPPPPLPGRNANIRNSVIAKPVCSSGASDKSGRLVIAIW